MLPERNGIVSTKRRWTSTMWQLPTLLLRDRILRPVKVVATTPSSGSRPDGQGNNNNKKNNNKDRFKKPVIKQEVSEEDVAKQVKETLARLTTKGKNKTSKYRKEKREMASNRMQELEDQEMAESKVLKLD